MINTQARKQTQNGFTLLELMIVIMITMLVMGGGIAGYVQLTNRQNLLNAGKQLQLLMRAAEKRARSGDKPAGCDHLTGYRISIPTLASTTVLTYAECDNGEYADTNSNYTFPNGVTTQTVIDMTFSSLQRGVKNPGAVSLVSAGNGKTYSFTVDQGGGISEGVIQ